MPILIKELHVKIHVDNDADKHRIPRHAPQNKEQIVAECVAQVMQIMANIKER